QSIKILRQLAVTVTQDNRRLPCCAMVTRLQSARSQIAAAEAAGGNLRKALKDLLEPVWLERYLSERIEPLREEFAALEARIRQLTPTAFNAVKPGK
ncbi:MAG: hypothetical protein WC299_14850, partial [Kiritimatiellia bacterium]